MNIAICEQNILYMRRPIHRNWIVFFWLSLSFLATVPLITHPLTCLLHSLFPHCFHILIPRKSLTVQPRSMLFGSFSANPSPTMLLIALRPHFVNLYLVTSSRFGILSVEFDCKHATLLHITST